MNRTPDWRDNGVRVVRRDQTDPNTPQTPGMHREAAVTRSVGAEKIWAGTAWNPKLNVLSKWPK